MRNNPDEQERLRRLERYRISRTPPEAAFDDITRLLAVLFSAPIAYLCTAEAECHWFKSRIGIDLDEVPRSISFCDHTMKQEGIMAVPDATLDKRFAGSPMVTGPLHIRFYAGVTLKDADGFALGTLAVADTVPHAITEQQKDSLQRLANIALGRMELRKTQVELRETVAAAEVARQHAVSDHAELREVIECLPEAIVLLDGQNRLLLWNRNYEKMFPDLAEHLAPGETMETIHRVFLRKGLHRLKMSPEEQEEWLKNRMERLNQAGTIYEERRADGRMIRYDQHPTPDGKKVYVRTDVTDERNAMESFRLLFENNHGIARSVVFESMFVRERLGSTGLGQGVVDFPHHAVQVHRFCAFRETAAELHFRIQFAVLVQRPDFLAVASCQQFRCEAAEIVGQVGDVAFQHGTGVVVAGGIHRLR